MSKNTIYKGMIKLKSTDQVIIVFFNDAKQLDPDSRFWVFDDRKGSNPSEKWVSVQDICYFEYWRES